jgi:predicted MFS family arabinose efflux permease
VNKPAPSIEPQEKLGPFEPLRNPVFRSIWIASLFSNLGFLVLGVGAAWEMTRLTGDPAMVALVQSALIGPGMLVAMPAGAIADMFDRRKVALASLTLSMLAGAALAVVAYMGGATPWVLLAFCALVGTSFALFIPTWQASVPEQVSTKQLPAAVALGAISFNVARSVGPALGGVLLLTVGAKATFALSAFGVLPLIIAFIAWKRPQAVRRFPPERIDRAMLSGARFTMHSPALRNVLVRVLFYTLGLSAMNGLAPLIARDVLHGTAATYGLLLGVFGAGAVGGALFVGTLRRNYTTETMVRAVSLSAAAALVLIALSSNVILTCLAYAVLGANVTLCLASLNITVQFSAPRWVIARALSMYQSAMAAGWAIGAWIWGHVADGFGLQTTMLLAAAFTLGTILIGMRRPLASTTTTELESVELSNTPDVAMELTQRSGPVVIEVDYDVDPANARPFYNAMQSLRGMRLRNGGIDWSISRDIANPALWTERFCCPTWGDYLRLRDRYTLADSTVQAEADQFDRGLANRRVRRKLERPFGSVRWQEDAPDPKVDTVGIVGP